MRFGGRYGNNVSVGLDAARKTATRSHSEEADRVVGQENLENLGVQNTGAVMICVALEKV